MENNNRLKLRISRMFNSSFASCRSKNISDVIDQPFFFPENRHHRQLIELFSPKPSQSLPSFCKPKWVEPDQTQTRPKISDRNTLLVRETPNSPAAENSFYEKSTKKKTRKKKTHMKKTRKSDKNEVFESITADYYKWCSSDEEEDDETTLFSSKSLSSDSSESLRKHRDRRNGGGGCKDAKATEVMPLEKVGRGKVKDSFAVVKKSRDPHNDFRTSMVEMIVEKQIFGGEDLENLLQCFLSLNSHHHHRVIVQVFNEIWETLFSDWP